MAGWLVFALAVLSSIVATDRPTWWKYSLCALGMDSSPRPWIFRSGVLATACVFGLLGTQTHNALGAHVRAARLRPRQAQAVTTAIALVVMSLVVVALVPYDAGAPEKLVHNLAGWGSGWVCAVSMILVLRSPRFLGRLFSSQTWAALAAFLIFFAAFEVGALTYALAEIGAVSVMAVWTALLFANLERLGGAT
jgi:hypothetical protein